MKVSMMALSITGQETGIKLKQALEARGMEVSFMTKSKYIPDSTALSLDEWTSREFMQTDVMIWICACGIAVRHIAPYIKSKKKDPAVIVLDECGKFAISLLSGHLGGANELTLEIAEIMGAVPVVTTATDLHKCFAVDVFSKKNDCEIRNMTAAKEVSAALLAGREVGFFSEFPWEGIIPKGLVLCDKDGKRLDVNEGNESDESSKRNKRDDGDEDHISNKKGRNNPMEIGIAVTIHRGVRPFASTVTIIPKAIVLGMGCRRGKDEESILKAAKEAMLNNVLYQDAFEKIVSIDLKKDEPGLQKLAEHWKIPFETFSEEILMNAKGEYTTSSFVKSITGVDNVCERSAVIGSDGGELIQKKVGKDGVTTAIAVKNRRIRFE